MKYLSGRNVAHLSAYEIACTVPSRKVQKRKVNGLSKDAVRQLLEMPKLSTKTGRRDLVFMILLYSTAARLDEVLSLKIRDIHLELQKPYVSIIGKGRKLRTLYLMPKAVAHPKHICQNLLTETKNHVCFEMKIQRDFFVGAEYRHRKTLVVFCRKI